MITLLFILLKLSESTVLSWWWIIPTLLLDLKKEIGEFLNPFFDPRDTDKLPPSPILATTRRNDIQ